MNALGSLGRARELISLKFDNRLIQYLPIDRSSNAFTPKTVEGCCFSVARPSPLLQPKVVAWSPSALASIGLSPSADSRTLSAEWEHALSSVFSGNLLPDGAEPYSHCYAGYQFGKFVGQLGDGAAICLGEVVGKKGERNEVQLKGSGPTAFSRQFDGRKVLRSSIREFLCSEYMHHLGIPSTRAGVIISSDTRVARDPLYDGNSRDERCAVVTRIAQTFFRFGSFEICRKPTGPNDRGGPSAETPFVVNSLLDYTIENYFQDIVATVKKHHVGDQELKRTTVVAVFEKIMTTTATLVAQWQSVGFCHGVLNTDNMSILGVTIDYGPFAFMAHYDKSFVSNLSDSTGRYAFSWQPGICGWNLLKLAEAIDVAHPGILSELQRVVRDQYVLKYTRHLNLLMASKLGFDLESVDATSAERVHHVIHMFFEALQTTNASMHSVLWEIQRSFPFLSSHVYNDDAKASTSPVRVEVLYGEADDLARRLTLTCCAKPKVTAARETKRMKRLQPQIPLGQLQTLRKLMEEDPLALTRVFNGQSNEAIESYFQEQEKQGKQWQDAKAAYDAVSSMSEADKVQRDQTVWQAFLREYFTTLSAVQVTSRERGEAALDKMLKSTPRFVLYPWVLDAAIQKAEEGDFSLTRELMDRITRPFDVDPRDEVLWSMQIPDDHDKYACSCSS